MPCCFLILRTHYQMLYFLLGFCSNNLQSLFVWESRFPPLFLWWMKNIFFWAEIRWLIWPLKNISFHCLEKLLLCFCCHFGSSSIYTSEMLPDQFCRIWLNLSRVYIPVHSISSHIISNQFISTVPHARAITLPPPCLIDDVVIFGLHAVPYPLNTFLFPSFLVKVDLGFSELCSLF